MRNAAVTPEGGQIRWVELPGQEPSRVYVPGPGATSPAYFAEVAVVLVDVNLDPIPPAPGSAGSSGIAAYSEEEFLAGGWEEARDRAGSHWWSTMRLAGREALHRSAVHLTRGTAPTMRELLRDLKIPSTYLLPKTEDRGERAQGWPGAYLLAGRRRPIQARW
ncbi:hypothetical protein ACFZCV_35435 [Streptomyces sp. NPDC007920]|uniref:hypothetical protein n=1 Tax=Streptomyces sp. NPDC007920 TaxID=3364794 RepID=UPI0036EBA8EF